MLYHISNLKQSEQQLVKNTPFLISILIAGSDGIIENEEIEKSLNLIHTKSFSEASDIRYLYKEIETDAENKIKTLLAQLPQNAPERETAVVAELQKLNEVLIKLDNAIAVDFYKSIRKFAVQVANISGGILGMNKINYHEKEMLKLPMINNPETSES